MAEKKVPENPRSSLQELVVLTKAEFEKLKQISDALFAFQQLLEMTNYVLRNRENRSVAHIREQMAPLVGQLASVMNRIDAEHAAALELAGGVE